MEKWESIDPSQVHDGLLLNEEQIHYMASCIKETVRLLDSLKEGVDRAVASSPDNDHFNRTKKLVEKLHNDLEYCVTILRKEK